MKPADERVSIVAYDAAWPARFDEERSTLEGAVGEWVVGGIYHVGSTAVPGLEAKPVIDILVGVGDLESSRGSLGALEGLGYLYAPYRRDEMHWLCKPSPSHRTHHLHLVPAGSRRFRDELEFRDRLREDSELASRYGALKRRLADRWGHDRERYTAAKAEFIEAALAPPG